ncbi:adenosylcobinamide-phosphate synthase CbiB [Pseudodesulfovibrio piezophilus]|uniref:Cobalamin biosynthesis protein CobD n=1 Tax=Pseudodesulfovibrio piezophilus (strain DSM 21447 / JCM 15486 / C1TLV30) TaxID=1322246 RepID=M1WQL1_PSEP2|nr:adenosylcobinamide-phosphate synthase CbiB [Pseudodesulfovibrio piezophilus]CCH47757.1 Cobalamin biosynthesis protein CobD [Pseudodesulfovibrio piezophilus C1TLV30]
MTLGTILVTFSVPLLAVLADSVLGDPQNFPHPVRLIGKILNSLEKLIRRVELDLYIAGWVTLLLLTLGAWSLVAFLTALPYLGFLLSIYLSYAGLALGCLVQESRKVVHQLEIGDLNGARKELSMLVSRDTTTLDEDGIRQTLAETLSENLNDGFVAPLFYLTLLGPEGLWVYKVVSTMDSMWGYKTEKYRILGYAAAKIDDILAFFPARITAYSLLMIGRLRKLQSVQAVQSFPSDARKMESPNAGWPMAATAWLLGGQMGGRTVYFGEIKEKPILGPRGQKWTKEMISELFLISKSTGYLVSCLFIVILPWLRFLL